jgi:hypothetical protein
MSIIALKAGKEHEESNNVQFRNLGSFNIKSKGNLTILGVFRMTKTCHDMKNVNDMENVRILNVMICQERELSYIFLLSLYQLFISFINL